MAGGAGAAESVADSDIATTIAHCAARIKRRATSTALEKLLGLAVPFPAMENAVPWSGLVRTCGEAERHVHRLLEIDGLEGRQALVVVEGDRDVELAAQLAGEERVRGLAAREPRDSAAEARRGSGRSCPAPRSR